MASSKVSYYAHALPQTAASFVTLALVVAGKLFLKHLIPQRWWTYTFAAYKIFMWKGTVCKAFIPFVGAGANAKFVYRRFVSIAMQNLLKIPLPRGVRPPS